MRELFGYGGLKSVIPIRLLGASMLYCVIWSLPLTDFCFCSLLRVHRFYWKMQKNSSSAFSLSYSDWHFFLSCRRKASPWVLLCILWHRNRIEFYCLGRSLSQYPLLSNYLNKLIRNLCFSGRSWRPWLWPHLPDWTCMNPLELILLDLHLSKFTLRLSNKPFNIISLNCSC